jgi:hypothetical protein
MREQTRDVPAGVVVVLVALLLEVTVRVYLLGLALPHELVV